MRSLFRTLLRAPRRRGPPDARAARNDGRALEAWCAGLLSDLGWRARRVGGVGDQGADVLAERDGFRLLIQCKAYAGPTGNGAVQEAFAGQRHHGAHAACVVATAGYTPGAVALGATTRVLLLAPADLVVIDRRLGLARGRTIVSCRRCRLRLCVPTGRIGRVRCPRCRVRGWHWS